MHCIRSEKERGSVDLMAGYWHWNERYPGVKHLPFDATIPFGYDELEFIEMFVLLCQENYWQQMEPSSRAKLPSNDHRKAEVFPCVGGNHLGIRVTTKIFT